MKKVIFIDSGIGGLSVLSEFAKKSYDCDITYVADNANVPYGNKTHQKIVTMVEGLFNRFVPFDTDIVCLACNTMSSVALNEMKSKSFCKIIGVMPDVDSPIADGKSNIMLLATERTISENIEKYRKKKLILNPQRDLARIIERYIFNPEIIVEKIEQLKLDIDSLDVDGMILGCTHYSLVKDIFENVFSKYVTFYDSNKSVANEMINNLALTEIEKAGRNNQVTVQLTDNSDAEIEKYLTLLKNIV